MVRLLHLLPPELAHDTAIKLLRFFPVKNIIADIDTKDLAQTLLGLHFPHPLGLAAGFDKHGDVSDKLGQLGFSFLEVGSVTPRPQPGNLKPRVFRVPEQHAIINRFGFNSKGLDYMQHKLEKRPRTCITGINLGKNKDSIHAEEDFVLGAQRLDKHADYFTINVSSPNTPGLRDLQTPNALEPIIREIRGVTQKPLFVKLSPDMALSQEKTLVEFLAEKIDGIIVSNTTMVEGGGLSGPPLKQRSTDMLRRVYTITQGRIVLIGCGGISSGADAYEKLCAGAQLLQIYTAFIYQGPAVIRRILLELKALKQRNV
ncbi:MAG: dihydroorotate dehydrogenase (quinone) [Gammaproteobacteria bacterium]